MQPALNRKALFAVLAASTLVVMAGSIISPVINSMQGILLGADENNIRFVITMPALFIALFSPVFGSLIDRIGVKKPFVFGLALYAVAGISGFFILDIALMLVSRALLGIAVAAIANTTLVIILNAYTGAQCSRVMGLQASTASLGAVVWPLLGGVLGLVAWNLPFSIYLVGVPIGILAWLTIPEVKEQAKPNSGFEAETNISVLETIKKEPFILAVYALGLWTMVLLYTNVTFVPQLLVSDFAIRDSLTISLFIGVMGTAAATSAFAYKKIKSKLSYGVIAFAGLGLWAFGFLLISQVISVWTVVISIVLYGVGQGMMMPTLNLWVGELTHTCVRGRMISYLTMFLFVGQFLPPLIFNPVFSMVGFNGVFLAAGVACAVLTTIFLVKLASKK